MQISLLWQGDRHCIRMMEQVEIPMFHILMEGFPYLMIPWYLTCLLVSSPLIIGINLLFNYFEGRYAQYFSIKEGILSFCLAKMLSPKNTTAGEFYKHP